jgi:hypothetical protein
MKWRICRAFKTCLLTLVLAVSLLATGCSVQATGEVGQFQQLAKICPQGSKQASYASLDVSGSTSEDDVKNARAHALRDIVTRTTVCEGHLRVDAFTGSSAAGRVLYEGTFELAGATDIAKMRTVSKVVDEAMATIDENLAAATTQLSATTGSDVTSQFRRAAEYGAQMAEQEPILLTVDLMTDGVQNVGVALHSSLTPEEALDLATKPSVVNLPKETVVKVSGLGKTTDPKPSSSYVEALKVFYEAYCARTGATHCSAVTEYTAGS